MATAVLIVTLLTLAASLASWLFSQWLARRVRVSGAALAVGGTGAVLLIGAVALVIVTASTWWQKLMPVYDFSPLIEPAPAPARSAQIPVERQPDPVPPIEQYAERVEIDASSWLPQVEPPAELEPAAELEPPQETAVIARYRFGEPKDGMLEAAESQLEASQHAAAIDTARRYLTEHPSDPDMSSLLARSLFAAEHPGSASMIPAVVVAQWPATDCVESMRADDSSNWILDNGCGRVVAVLFASCELSEFACFTNTLVSRGWSYQQNGILLTAANDKPVALRLGDAGPMVAPIFTIRDVAGVRRQIRYLACEVTAPRVLQLLHDSAGYEPTPQQLLAELRADTCYSQVVDWSHSGHRLGASPDALLRQGIN